MNRAHVVISPRGKRFDEALCDKQLTYLNLRRLNMNALIYKKLMLLQGLNIRAELRDAQTSPEMRKKLIKALNKINDIQDMTDAQIAERQASE